MVEAKKKTIGLIGLGTISMHYFKGINESPHFELTCVCDKDTTAKGVDLYADIPFFTDYRQMIKIRNPDYVAISVDVANHFALASDLLQLGVHVLIEKPAALSLDEIDTLLQLAEAGGLYFDILFHWQHGSEIYFLQDNLDRFGKVRAIHSTVYDPYTNPEGCQIAGDKIHLMGSWLDSGVNILSAMALFADLEGAKLSYRKHEMDHQNGLPFKSSVGFLTPSGIELRAEVDWNAGVNFKKSTLITKLGVIDVFHSQQAVFFNGEEVFREDSMPRLTRHYYNYFANLPHIPPHRTARQIHALLFDGN